MRFPEASNLLSSFIWEERWRFDDDDNNVFGFAFGKIGHYIWCVKAIAVRYHANVASLRKHERDLQAAWDRRRSGVESVDLTPQTEQLYEQSRHIELDIESFYLFAKILLGKVANALEFYFGQARGVSLKSHDSLRKSLADYAAQKELQGYEAVLDAAEGLQRRVVDFRDKKVEHDTNPRSVRGFSSFPDGAISMTCTEAFPKGPMRQVDSVPVERLEEDLCDYLQTTIEFVRRNRDRTRLRPKKS
jgi:hypothetical protein